MLYVWSCQFGLEAISGRTRFLTPSVLYVWSCQLGLEAISGRTRFLTPSAPLYRETNRIADQVVDIPPKAQFIEHEKLSPTIQTVDETT